MVAIFVILTIVAFIAIDSLVQWSEAKAEGEPLTAAPQSTVTARPVFAFARVSMPQGVFVDPSHTWISLDASGRTRVGMDDFVQRVIGRIDEIELPEIGQEVHRGQKLFTVRQGGRSANFQAPIDGVICAVNAGLAHHPEAIKSDPYRYGWVCALKPKNLAKNLKHLFIAEEARAWLHEEMEKFREFIMGRPFQNAILGQVLQDGGQMTENVLELLDEETWTLFTDQFLGHLETVEILDP